jgi:hypothetical protein
MTQPVSPAVRRAGCSARRYTRSVTNDDVANFQDIHRKLQNRQTVKVGVHDQIGDVPVDEQLYRQQSADFVGGHSTVRGANPEIAGRLLSGKLDEEIRVLPPNASGPSFVIVEEMVERLHRGECLSS